jgi:hypothetical protein
MISPLRTARLSTFCATLTAVAACGGDPGALDSENAVIDPPAQCSPSRPDCSISEDFPVGSDLNAGNSAGLRYSDDTNSLVVDRVSSLPDIDGDGVPDDADDCPGTPDWITCDNDPTNDGLYATVFYDPSGAAEVTRASVATTTADIPQIDVYFLIDATPTLSKEIEVLQTEILLIIDDIRSNFEEDEDVRFGLGLYREYPLFPLAAPYSQAPYHHILDLTDDESLMQTAVSTLNTVANTSDPSAATQALYSVASGLGLGDMVPNRGSCPNTPDANIGYPCFRPGALHVVMNITDAEVYNGPPGGTGGEYGDPPFALGVGAGVMNLPPVEMFPALFAADSADSADTALDLGDLSGQSLTLMGMSTLLNDLVNTAVAPGCLGSGGTGGSGGGSGGIGGSGGMGGSGGVGSGAPGDDMDGKDVVLALRFDSAVVGFSLSALANNTHWPGANVALFDGTLLDPLDPAKALACNGGAGVNRWGSISWDPIASRPYYLVADGIIPASDPGDPEDVANGAFSISIVHDGDPPDPSWFTSDAPVVWEDVEDALLASDLRVASVVTLKDAMDIVSDGNDDARLIAAATDALTKTGEWVWELPSASGAGLGSAISNTIAYAKTDSVYDISLVEVDNDATPGVDESDFVARIRDHDCAEGDILECDSGSGDTCNRCDVGAVLEYEVVFRNTSVAPTTSSQVFDFEVVAWADDTVEGERIPVRVMVPDAASHEFDDLPGVNFYRNVYDTTLRCIAATYEAPKWGNLEWEGSTPGGTSIEFQIRTANSVAGLLLAIPAVIVIPTDTTSHTLNLTEELIADGQPYGLPYIQITALLNPTNTPPATPTLRGWSFEFVCAAAQ